MGLMNVMCDISQFVVVIPVPVESSATLAILFYAKYFVEIISIQYYNWTELSLK